MSAAAGATVTKGVTWKTILVIGLLIASLSILAALPLSFFMNGNLGDWFGNLPLDLIPPPDELPEGWENWEIPDWADLPSNWQDWQLPEGWQDLLADFNGTLPPGEIPFWLMAGALAYLLAGGELPGGGGIPGEGVGGLPGMGSAMGSGLGPFGTGSTKVWVSENQPWRYWRIRSYDYFEGSIWLVADNATSVYTQEDYAGTNYTVYIGVFFQDEGFGTLPLPSLWNRPIIHTDLQVFDLLMQPAVNVSWNLLEDEYGTVHWNASVGIPGYYIIKYTVSYDDSVSLEAIESSVYAGSPLSFQADPGDGHNYTQIPDLSDPSYTAVLQDMQNLASNPALASMNTYEVAQAVMEYFKTRWWWTPFRAQIPGQDFDPAYLINNGYGASHDFASNYVMYLRNLGISSRLVWGGVGYQIDPQFSLYFSEPLINLTHSHFWAEVWIPRSITPGDGEWVQFDPSPIPQYMWLYNRTLEFLTGIQQLDQFNVRMNDTRVETSHYTMEFSASVPYDTPQNRVTDTFDLTANLLRDGKPLTTTWLNEAVNYEYIDVTDNLLVGTSAGAINNHAFDANSLVGAHRFNASFYAVVNETIVTCNGTTSLVINNLSPRQLFRTVDLMNVTSTITDPTSGKSVKDVELTGWMSDLSLQIPDNLAPQYTDTNGQVTTSHIIPYIIPVGLHNFTTVFPGIFTVDYPDPYPDFNVNNPQSASQSQNETITVLSTLIINMSASGGSGTYLPRGHNIVFEGYLTFDNGTGIDGGLVTVWWVNSTGTYNLSADYAAADGYYSVNYFIPTTYSDPANSNDVYVYANFIEVWGNCTTNPTTTYHVRASNWTTISLSTDAASLPYIIRNSDNVHVWGSLKDTQGVASTAYQPIEIRVFETGQLVSSMIITDANGNFDAYVQIPDSQPVGSYNLSASFQGIWYYNMGADQITVPSSSSSSVINSTHTMIVVASTVLTKTSNPTDIGRTVTPSPIIAGDPVYVTGYLLFENGTPLQSELVEAWWIEQDGTEHAFGSDTTDSFGFYNVTVPQFPPTQPTNVIVKVNYSAGALFTNYILNASTDQDPPVVWAVDIFISSVNPGAATRGVTPVFIDGWIAEKHGWFTPYETVYLTLDGQNILDIDNNPVSVVTNAFGNFSTSFILSNSYTLNSNSLVNLTLTNSSFIVNSARTGWLNINCTTNIMDLAVDRTALIGENLTISARLVDNLNQNIKGNVTLLVNGGSVASSYSDSGIFSWDLSIPFNPIYAGLANITAWHNGSSITFPSASALFWNVPRGADVAITNIGGHTDLSSRLTLYRSSTVTVIGTLTDNESSYVITNRLVQIYYNSTLLGQAYTDNNGGYSIQISIPSTVGNTTLYAVFLANDIYISSAILIETVVPASLGEVFMQFLPWILGIVGAIVATVVGVKLYSRRNKAEVFKITYKGDELTALKAKFMALAEGQRFREAIIFAYQSYLLFLKGYLNVIKRPGQTAREFAMNVVKNVHIQSTLIYPFTNQYEEARFGPRSVDETSYKKSIELFLKIYEQILSKARPTIPVEPVAA